MTEQRRGSTNLKPGLFGIFSYFSQIDTDGSGFLELNEIEDLAKQIFGEDRHEEVQSYVVKVFEEFDTDHSGELSYEEARNFIKGIYNFFEGGGKLSAAEKRKLLGIIDSMDDEIDETILEEDITPVAAPPVVAAAPEPVSESDGDKQAPIENKPVELKVEIPPVYPPEPNPDILKLIADSQPDGPQLGPYKEMLNKEGEQVLGHFGELLGATGASLPGKHVEIVGPPVAESLLGPFNEIRGMDGKPKPGKMGEMQDKDAKPLLGKFGEILDVHGKAILGPYGEIIGPDGRAILGANGELLGPDGKPLLGKFGQILGPGGVCILGKYGEILGADGKPVLGKFKELLGPDGKALLGQWGQIRGADGKSILGSRGELLGPDGKPLGPPLLGPDGKPLFPDEDAIAPKQETRSERPRPTSPESPRPEKKEEKKKKEEEPREIKKLQIDKNMGKRNSVVSTGDGTELKEWEYDNSDMPQSSFEQKKLAARKKQAKLDALKARRKEGHDGYHKTLEIYLPKSSIDELEELEEFGVVLTENTQYFRDPVTKQWIGKKQVTNPTKPAAQPNAQPVS